MAQIGADVLFLLLALVGPGAGIQRWARRPIDVSLILPLGAVQAAAAYWLSLVLGGPWLFPVLLLLSVGGLVRGVILAPDQVPLRTLLLPGLALVALLAVTQYGSNRFVADGSFLLDPMGDQPLHAGIAWELTLPYPPQVPGLAGVRLDYHYGADLVRAAALRWAGLHPYDALNRLEPTLWALGLMLSLAALARRLGGTALAVALAPWTVLATDFSFVCAALGGIGWWTDMFRGNLLMSLAFTNPVVPALMVAVGAFVAYSRFEAGDGRAWLGLAALQAAAVPFLKVFLGAQLALAFAFATFVAAARAGPKGRMRSGAPALALAAIALAGIVPLVGGASARQVEVVVAPLRLVRESLQQLRIEDLSPAALAVATLPWLVVSLGLRLIGLRRAGRAAIGGSVVASASAVLALSGWPLGLLLHVAARDLGGGALPSATIYFLEQSGAVLWVFAALALGAWADRGRRRVVALAGAALLTLPATVEFAVRKARVPSDRVAAKFVRAIDAVAKDGQPGDVVLEKPALYRPPLPVVLAGRRVVYERYTPYLTQFAPPAELRRRQEAVYRFFSTADPAEAMAIARSVGARYVCLYRRRQRIHFDGEAVLSPVYEERGARCSRIEPDRLKRR